MSTAIYVQDAIEKGIDIILFDSLEKIILSCSKKKKKSNQQEPKSCQGLVDTYTPVGKDIFVHG